MRLWLQVRAAMGSGPGRCVSTPSRLRTGDVAYVCAHFCVQIHLSSPLGHSLATSCGEGTVKSAERM